MAQELIADLESPVLGTRLYAAMMLVHRYPWGADAEPLKQLQKQVRADVTNHTDAAFGLVRAYADPQEKALGLLMLNDGTYSYESGHRVEKLMRGRYLAEVDGLVPLLDQVEDRDVRMSLATLVATERTGTVALDALGSLWRVGHENGSSRRHTDSHYSYRSVPETLVQIAQWAAAAETQEAAVTYLSQIDKAHEREEHLASIIKSRNTAMATKAAGLYVDTATDKLDRANWLLRMPEVNAAIVDGTFAKALELTPEDRKLGWAYGFLSHMVDANQTRTSHGVGQALAYMQSRIEDLCTMPDSELRGQCLIALACYNGPTGVTAIDYLAQTEPRASAVAYVAEVFERKHTKNWPHLSREAEHRLDDHAFAFTTEYAGMENAERARTVLNIIGGSDDPREEWYGLGFATQAPDGRCYDEVAREERKKLPAAPTLPRKLEEIFQ